MCVCVCMSVCQVSRLTQEAGNFVVTFPGAFREPAQVVVSPCALDVAFRRRLQLWLESGRGRQHCAARLAAVWARVRGDVPTRRAAAGVQARRRRRRRRRPPSPPSAALTPRSVSRPPVMRLCCCERRRARRRRRRARCRWCVVRCLGAPARVTTTGARARAAAHRDLARAGAARAGRRRSARARRRGAAAPRAALAGAQL